MKITFNTLNTQETEKAYNEKRETARTEKNGSICMAAFYAESENAWQQNQAVGKEKGKSLIEIQQDAGNVNVAVQQDYMTVMSHTMSEEDYAKMSEEGFHFEGLDPEEAVTIVDKIKAELARSGQYIAGYTDDLDVETLAAAVGSDGLARTISDSFQKADIPMTQENIDAVARAWEMASQLETPGEGASQYMIDNGLEPEIWNLYLAQSSGARNTTGGQPRYYAEDIQGYFTQSAAVEADANLQTQMDKVIESAGLTVNEESRQWAEWLMSKGLPLTADSLQQYEKLQGLTFPVSEEVFAQAAVAAIVQGKEPIHANLAHSENLYEKAAALAEGYYSEKVTLLDAGDITARRQLEEIRLRMTAELNVKLLKSGFSIDTAPMEQLLEALKQAEVQLAESYFPGDTQAIEKYSLYQQTGQVVAELHQLPVQILGSSTVLEMQTTVAQFHAEGKALQADYDKAQESYEALMTAPRSDMGDSIRKAFANVDDILADLGYEPTEENRRAARILGYNRMSMTVENLESVKAADRQVCSMVEKLTPAATLKMIRDGINPLEQSFAELEEYFNTLPETYEEGAESYSRFLYQLEKRQDITEQEREAYIGVYRLLRQIEKSDGAVIGAVVNTQAELQFSNLLSAVRTGKFKHMDVRATDETGLTAELSGSTNSISEQIAKGIAAAREMLTEVSENETANREFEKALLEQTRQASNVNADSAILLQRGEIPANAENLLAAQALLHDAESPFKKWKEKEEQLKAQSDTTYTDVWEAMSDKETFQESYQEMLTDISAQVEAATMEEAKTSLDVRELQSIHKQLNVAMAMASSEEYILPMYIGEELAKVHLTVEHDTDRQGAVSIRVNLSEEMQVEAHFRLHDQKLSGFLLGNTEAEVTKLQKTADIFLESLKKQETAKWDVEQLPIVSGMAEMYRGNNVGKDTGASVEETDAATNTELYQIAKLFLQAIKQ